MGVVTKTRRGWQDKFPEQMRRLHNAQEPIWRVRNRVQNCRSGVLPECKLGRAPDALLVEDRERARAPGICADDVHVTRKECLNETFPSITGSGPFRSFDDSRTRRRGRSAARCRFSCRRRASPNCQARLARRRNTMGAPGMAWRRRAVGRRSILSGWLLRQRMGISGCRGRRRRRRAWCSGRVRLVLSNAIGLERLGLCPEIRPRLLSRREAGWRSSNGRRP